MVWRSACVGHAADNVVLQHLLYMGVCVCVVCVSSVVMATAAAAVTATMGMCVRDGSVMLSVEIRTHQWYYINFRVDIKRINYTCIYTSAHIQYHSDI